MMFSDPPKIITVGLWWSKSNWTAVYILVPHSKTDIWGLNVGQIPAKYKYYNFAGNGTSYLWKKSKCTPVSILTPEIHSVNLEKIRN